MDTLAHTLWTYIIYFSHKLKWWAILIAVLPDIFAFTPHFFVEHFVGGQIIFDALYNFSHSFISVLLIGLIVFLFARKYLILLGAWALHIFIDIFTHPFGYYPTNYLYPFTSPFMFAIDYRTFTFTIINYVLIMTILTTLVYFYKIRKKNHKNSVLHFIPAAKFHVFSPLFDLGCSILGLGKTYRDKIIKKINIESNKKITILDAGCGTGSLAKEVKKKYPNINLYAIDIDPNILSIAKKKGYKQEIHFSKASITKLPFPSNHFDVVYSSLVIHHLPTKLKQEALNEIKRVLKKEGKFFLIDLGKPKHWIFTPVLWFAYYFEEANDNYHGKLPLMMKNAGFTSIKQLGWYRGSIEFLVGIK
jgi:SAM-dependent methyltransferase